MRFGMGSRCHSAVARGQKWKPSGKRRKLDFEDEVVGEGWRGEQWECEENIDRPKQMVRREETRKELRTEVWEQKGFARGREAIVEATNHSNMPNRTWVL